MSARPCREGVRARTEQPDKARGHLRLVGSLYPDPEFEVERPRTRADCEDAPRPCPWISCRYHLYIDCTRPGSIKFNFPDKEVWDLEHSCVLDEIDGPKTLDEVGALLNLTRERSRQIEEGVLVRLGEDARVLATLERQVEFSEDEMKILEMARRITDINRKIASLKEERAGLLSKMEALSMKVNPDPEPPPPPPPPDVRQENVERWILDQMQDGEWVPTRRLGTHIPPDILYGDDPRKTVKKAIVRLAEKNLIENGKAEGHPKSWRLINGQSK